MQTDINDPKFPGMWLTVGEGYTLWAQFHLMKTTFDEIRGATAEEYTKLAVKNRDNKWWDFDSGKFDYEKRFKDIAVNGLAEYIIFFTHFKDKR